MLKFSAKTVRICQNASKYLLGADQTSMSVCIKFGNQIKNSLNGQHIVMMQRLHYLHHPNQKGPTEIVMNWNTPSTLRGTLPGK